MDRMRFAMCAAVLALSAGQLAADELVANPSAPNAVRPAVPAPTSQPAAELIAGPFLPPLTTRPGPDRILSTQPSVRVQRFKFTGNTKIPEAELQKVVAPYLGKTMSAEDMEEARVNLTK